MALPSRIFRIIAALSLGATFVFSTEALAATKKAVGKKKSASVQSLLVKRQYNSAIVLLERDAAAGNTSAQFRLGNLYRLGLGTLPNPSKARIWYEKASRKGHKGAARVLKRINSNVQPTEKKLALRNGEAVGVVPNADFAFLPKRDDAQQNWLALAAARNLVTAIDSLRQKDEANFRKLSANALFAATQARQPTAIKALLQFGVNPNEPNKAGLTPTMLAAQQADVASLQTLLASTPDLLLLDQNKDRALNHSARSCSADTFKLLLEAGAKDGKSTTPAITDVFKHCASPEKYLASAHGGMMFATDAQRRSVLWHATAREDNATLSQLLSAGADPNIADLNGIAPLQVAALAASPQNMKSLLIAGSDAAKLSDEGATALMFAAYSGCQNCIEQLPHSEDQVNLKDSNGNTSLMYAVKAQKPEMVKTLLAFGGNPNARNLSGDTPAKLGQRLGGELALLFKDIN